MVSTFQPVSLPFALAAYPRWCCTRLAAVDPDLPNPEDQPKRVFGIMHPNSFYSFEVHSLDRSTGLEIWRLNAICETACRFRSV